MDLESMMRDLSKKHVIEALPPILQRIAANPDFTEEACQILWELGRNDQRELNQFPYHAIRVLADMASYAPGKPVLYSANVLKAAEHWLDDPELPSYKNSPLDVVASLLAKQAEVQKLEGHTFSFGFARINLPAVANLRKEAIAYVEKCLMHPHPRVAARALQTVRDIVNHPASIGGRIVSAEEMEAWKPEQLEGVRLLKAFIIHTKSPVLLVLAIHELSWHAENGQPPEVARGVSEALALIPPSLERDLVTALTTGLYDIGRGTTDFATAQEKFLTDLAARLRKELRGADGITKIESILSDIHQARVPRSGAQLLWELGRNKAEAELILEHILGHEDCLLINYVAAVLGALRVSDVDSALRFAQRMVAGRNELGVAVAASYANTDSLRHPRDEDFVLLRTLLSRDENSKGYALEGLRRLKDAKPLADARNFQRSGIDLLVGTDIGQNPRMAEVFAEAIDSNFGIPPDLLTSDDIEKILQKLVPVREITHQNFHLARFLAFLVRRTPARVVGFFHRRIEYSMAHKDEEGYTPTPFGLEELFGQIADSPEHASIVRVLAEALKEQDVLKRYWLTKLFGLVAGSFGPSTQGVISELAEDKTEQSYNVIATLLHEAPREFIFSEENLCWNLLERANGISETAFKNIRGQLLASTQSGGFSGIPGEPFPQQVSIRERAAKLVSKYASKPVVAKFYSEVAQFAQEMIDKQLERDEEDFVE
jgi:hypothetical protein